MTVRCYYQAMCDKCGATLEFWALGGEMLGILERNGWTYQDPHEPGELPTLCPDCQRKKRKVKE